MGNRLDNIMPTVISPTGFPTPTEISPMGTQIPPSGPRTSGSPTGDPITDHRDDDATLTLPQEAPCPTNTTFPLGPVRATTAHRMWSLKRQERCEGPGFGRHLHSDTKSRSTISCRGYKYLFVVVDYDTKVSLGLLGVCKDDFTPLIKRWLRKFYNQYHRFPAYWRFDSGGEFLNHELIEFFDNKGIEYKFTTTNAKNQNATSERKIGVIWTATLKSLAHSGVPMQFWCYCAIYMIFIFNHIPHASMKFESPLTKAQMETFHELIRIFGCETWYVVEGTNNSVCRGRRGILLGISELKMGYDILDIESRTVIQCRNVMFNEVSMPFLIGLKPCKIILDFGTWPQPLKEETVSLDSSVLLKLGKEGDIGNTVPVYPTETPLIKLTPEAELDNKHNDPADHDTDVPLPDIDTPTTDHDDKDTTLSPIAPRTPDQWERVKAYPLDLGSEVRRTTPTFRLTPSPRTTSTFRLTPSTHKKHPSPHKTRVSEDVSITDITHDEEETCTNHPDAPLLRTTEDDTAEPADTTTNEIRHPRPKLAVNLGTKKGSRPRTSRSPKTGRLSPTYELPTGGRPSPKGKKATREVLPRPQRPSTSRQENERRPTERRHRPY